MNYYHLIQNYKKLQEKLTILKIKLKKKIFKLMNYKYKLTIFKIY